MNRRSLTLALLFSLAPICTTCAVEETEILYPSQTAGVKEREIDLAPAEKKSSIFPIVVVYGLLFFAAAIVFWKITGKGAFPSALKGKESHLNILETRMLGNKQFLVVVEYGQEKVLLGVGPGMVKHLCKLSSDKQQGDHFETCLEQSGEPEA